MGADGELEKGAWLIWGIPKITRGGGGRRGGCGMVVKDSYFCLDEPGSQFCVDSKKNEEN